MAKICPSPSHLEPPSSVCNSYNGPMRDGTITSSGRCRDELSSRRHGTGKRKSCEQPGLTVTPSGQPRAKKEKIVLPRHFLFGGNISDPLNLNSLTVESPGGSRAEARDESTTSVPLTYNIEVQRRSQSDDLYEPIEVLVPKRKRDPLNLDPKRRRKRKRRSSIRHSQEREIISDVAENTSLLRTSDDSLTEGGLEGWVSDSELNLDRVKRKQPLKTWFTEQVGSLVSSQKEDPTSAPMVSLSVERKSEPTASLQSTVTTQKRQRKEIVSPVVVSTKRTESSKPLLPSSATDSTVPETMRSRAQSFHVGPSSNYSRGNKSSFTRGRRNSGAAILPVLLSVSVPYVPELSSRGRQRSRHHKSSSRFLPAISAPRSILTEPLPSTSTGEPPNLLAQVSGNVGSTTVTKTQPKFNSKMAKYRYGNYNKYYGYRLAETTDDPRLQFLNPEWLNGKDVLDIGCNIGHVTISIARKLHPAIIVGIDIDQHLIGVARKNIRHYMDKSQSVDSASAYPPSFSKIYGPLSAPPLQAKPGVFPSNVIFKQANYVLDSEEQLASVKPEYDTILALSVTKWIHLNWGDDGLKRFFKRIFMNLRMGGFLILEPQPFVSYKKKKSLAPELYQNFQNIKFRQEQFNEYLLSKEVGFSTCKVIGVPQHNSKGFARPIYLFQKPSVPRISSTISLVSYATEQETEAPSTSLPIIRTTDSPARSVSEICSIVSIESCSD